MKGKKQWYEILGVSEDASTETIKAQYEKRILEAYEIGLNSISPNPHCAKSEEVVIERFLRSIITTINPSKKDVTLKLQSDTVCIYGDVDGVQVLTLEELGTIINVFEHLLNELQPVASSALEVDNCRAYIETLWRKLEGIDTRSSPIYNTYATPTFFIPKKLLRFYLPIFLGNADIIESLTREVQLAMVWSTGILAELKSTDLDGKLSPSPKCQKGSGLSLLVKAVDFKTPDYLKPVYAFLIEKGIKNPEKYLTEATGTKAALITIPFGDLKEIETKWPMLEQQELIIKLCIAIYENKLEEVTGLLSVIPKDVPSDVIWNIFHLATSKKQNIDVALPMVKALTQHFKDSVTQEFKNQLFFGMVGNKAANIVDCFYYAFQPNFSFQDTELGTVGHNFARRFRRLCETAEYRLRAQNSLNSNAKITLSIDDIQKYCGEELAELRKIRKTIQTMLVHCAEILDISKRTPAGCCEQYNRKTIFDQFMKLEIEEEAAAKLKSREDQLALRLKRAAIGLPTDGTTLYGLCATISWPQGVTLSAGLTVGRALEARMLGGHSNLQESDISM